LALHGGEYRTGCRRKEKRVWKGEIGGSLRTYLKL
jgi:hypothetical protein